MSTVRAQSLRPTLDSLSDISYNMPEALILIGFLISGNRPEPLISIGFPYESNNFTNIHFDLVHFTIDSAHLPIDPISQPIGK